MNRLDMAHDYLRDIISNWEYDESFNPVAEAWKYADAMQAEADKREREKAIKGAESSKQLFDSLTKKPNGECAHFHTTLNRTECFDCGEVLKMADSPQLDWQPDWGVAPEWANWWSTTKFGQGHWFLSEPKINKDSWVRETRECKQAPSFDYQGDWKQSLRKRPE